MVGLIGKLIFLGRLRMPRIVAPLVKSRLDLNLAVRAKTKHNPIY
jgi:hypothetical protein